MAKGTVKQCFLCTENLGLEIVVSSACVWGIRAKMCDQFYFFHKRPLVIN